jgi:Uncharacterised nucleotidyltransferase
MQTRGEEMRRDPQSTGSTAEILVALLRASLGTGAPPDTTCYASCNWQDLLALAKHHGLLPIVYRPLRDQPAGVPDEWRHRLKMQHFANAFRNQLVQADVDEIAAALNTERIAVIVMKGAALSRTLYDHPGLRLLTDIDLLVDEGDVGRANARLQQIRFEPIADRDADGRGPLCHMHFIYRRQPPRSLPVELHWRLCEPYQPYFFDLNAVRAGARPLPGLPPNVSTMAPEHELAHLCVHLDRHAVAYRSLLSRNDWFELLLLPQGHGRLLWLYDIALYLQRRADLIDWDRFVDTARRWAIDTRVHATLELSRRCLGVGPPAEVLRALHRGAPRIVERIAHRVVLASRRADASLPVGVATRPPWATRVSPHVLRLAHTWISLFPPAAYLQARYATPAGTVSLRSRHLRTVVPGIWAETRDRLKHALAVRRYGDGSRG